MIEIIYNIMFIIIVLNIISSIIFKQKKNGILCCGIIGFSSKKLCNPDKLALLMVHNSLERGKENTGIYSLETGVIKDELECVKFLATHSLPKTKLFIGHVRKSSVGSKIKENAHPFENDNIVLVHNGTLQNHMMICKDAGYAYTDYDTDTKVLAKLLDDDSKKENVSFSTLSKFTGAAALLFTDKRDPSVLYAYTNGDRPLFFGYLDKGMYISSLEESLSMIGCLDIKPFVKSYLHTIKDGQLVVSNYYEEKVIPTTTHHNHYNYGSNVTNVRYKNDYIDNFVEEVKRNSSLEAEKLVNRWVRAATTLRGIYCGINDVEFTKGDWYFVEDSTPDNVFEFQIYDDLDELVWVSKYHFSANYIDYPNKYGYAVRDIFSEAGKLMFTKGTIIEIFKDAKPKDKDNNSTILCVFENNPYDINLSCIRPALTAEVDKFVENESKLINQNMNSQIILFDKTKKAQDDGVSHGAEFLAEVDDDDVALTDFSSPFAVIDDSEDDKTDAFGNVLLSEQLNIPTKEELDTAKIVSLILDVLDDKVDDILEIIKDINLDPLQKNVQELKDLINESYNTEAVKEYIDKN